MNKKVPSPVKQDRIRIKSGDTQITLGSVEPKKGFSAQVLIKEIDKASKNKIFPTFNYNV